MNDWSLISLLQATYFTMT